MNKHNVDFRPYVVADFEAVADLWTRVNRELAPAGMETLFEQYIATTIAGELSRLLDIFSQARRNAFWVVELADESRRIVGTFGIECHSSDTTELRRMYIDGGVAHLNLTLCARTAREAKCFAAVASALFRCREADLSRSGARQVQMPGAGLRARIYRWFWAIGCSSNTLRDDLNQERATSGTLTFGAVTRAARLQIRRFRATQRAAGRSPSISA